jgi:hypothetical protein
MRRVRDAHIIKAYYSLYTNNMSENFGTIIREKRIFIYVSVLSENRRPKRMKNDT